MKGTQSFLCYGPNATNEVMMEVCTPLMQMCTSPANVDQRLH